MSGIQKLPGRTDEEKLAHLGDMTYKEQAQWFLNAFWKTFAENETEKIWNYAHMMAQLDTAKKMQGCALDEFMAHHFLEKNDETLTVHKMREQLREVGIEKVRLVPLVHYLIFRYKADWHFLVNAPQGNQEEIAKAQRLLDEVQELLAEAQAKEDQARREEAAAKAAAAEAERKAAAAKRAAEAAEAAAGEARRTAEEAKAAQRELEAALEALKEQEDAKNRKTEELKRKSEEGGLVQRNKAKNELAQHLGEDPLPLRRAKITTEAATKKAERTANAAAAAAEDAAAAARAAAAAADEAAEAAEQAKQAAKRAERSRQAAEQAVADAQKKVEEAEAYLEEVKNMPGGEGSVWWIERELHEAKAYLPTAKGGYKKEK